MTLKIRRAAVLGAGVMGAQIAAHLAAAGVRAYLLDLASAEPPADKNQAKILGKNFRSARAILAIENLKQLKPSPLYSANVLTNIIPGNFDDDLAVLADCDWIIEAVIERLDIKQSLHQRIAQYAKPHVPVTTNTSGISLADIAKDLPESYQQRFFGTHFFNPPRYMKLLETIPHPKTDAKLRAELETWAEARLGKGIVRARDTVNFIANRIGTFCTHSVLVHMDELGLNVETVDALTGPLIGRAKSATLRTGDVVGLDTLMAVSRNTYDKAPNDPYRPWFLPPKWIAELIERGALGQKTNSVGIYKKDKDAKGNTVILAYRPGTKTYEAQQPQSFAWEAEAAKERDTVKRIKLILAQNDAASQLVWRNLRDLFAYSAYLLVDIADGLVQPVDDALRWGFNWEMGPFELWQALGFDEILERMQKDSGTKAPLPGWLKPGLKFYDPAPGSRSWLATGPAKQLHVSASGNASTIAIPRPAHHFALPSFENSDDRRVVFSNRSASLVDIGDGVACLVFHSKMNTIDQGITAAIHQSLDRVERGFGGLVIANDAANFSAGANIKEFLDVFQKREWGAIDRIERDFQGAMQRLKFAAYPSVSCPAGLTLGGGCEVSLHTTLRVLAGETYAGLVEIGVGLIPAGGGTKELALRAYELAAQGEKADPMPFLQRAFQLIGMGKTSSSGFEAIEMGLYSGANSTVCIAKEHAVAQAKRAVLAMLADGYVPKTPQTVKVVGDPGVQTFKAGLYNMVEGRMISPYDAFIAERVAMVLCGGDVDAGTLVSEATLLDLERRLFVELCQQPKTAERIEYMLKNGKPLRN